MTTVPPYALTACARGTVDARPGEDDREEPLSEEMGRTRQEPIDGGLGPVARGRIDADLVVGDLDVTIGGNDIDRAGLERLLTSDSADR